MPLSETQERPIVEIENQLGLPAGFLKGLYDHEDDWSFVIKSHAFLEAALTHLLADHLGKEDLLPVFAYLETSNVRTGKLAFVKAIDRAVFTAHGEAGCMVPNQYWTPGMFAPMPLMGKYFSYYENKFMPPRQLGRKNAERFVYELYSENSGSCRFHRKWVEDIIDEIILSHFDLDFDFWRDQFDLARGIHDHQSARGVMWESERVVDIIQGFLEKWERNGLQEPELPAWLEKFRADKWQAAREFWQEMYDGMCEAFAQGLREPAVTQWPNGAPK